MKYIYYEVKLHTFILIYVEDRQEIFCAINRLRMTLKLSSFYFDVESGDSAPPSQYL